MPGSTPPPPAEGNDHRAFSSTSPRRESLRDNAAFPSVHTLNETLLSPPQYTRDLQPGQVRLANATSSTPGPSRVIGFQPISRGLSSGGGNPAPDVPSTRSALTSARPPDVRSSTSFSDLHPPRDVHDEFKYLHLGDRKMKVVITRGVGPAVGRFGKEGRPKPRRVKVDEVGGRVEGFIEVGKVDACIGLDVTISGRSLCTLYYNGQPSLLHGRRLIKHRITLFPSSDTPPIPNAKGKGKATEPTIPHNTTFAFGFDFPRYCELEDSKDGPVEDDDDDYPVEKHAAEPSSFGARAIDIAHSSSPSGRRPSLVPPVTSSFGMEEDPACASTGTSPSSWKNRMENKSPPTGLGIGKFLKRNSFSAAGSHGHSASASSQQDVGSPEDSGRRGFLRRISTSQSVPRPPLEEQYDLPPTTNLMLGDLQAEVEYHIKIRLRRKGLRFNDSIVLNCTYEPAHSMTQPERFTPFPNAIIHPDYPHWQTLPLEGGHAIAQKGKRVHDVEAGESAIKAEFPLLTFASSDTAEWKIHLIRVVTIRIHQKEMVRVLPLKTMWTIDAIDEVQSVPVSGHARTFAALRQDARSPTTRADDTAQPQSARPSSELTPASSSASDHLPSTPTDSIPQEPPSFDTVEQENLATPPPEFAETYAGPSNLRAPFPPEIPNNTNEENVYVAGKISLCRTAFKSILPPLSTPDIAVDYYLDVSITPKSGSIKESFAPLKQRWPVMYERL
ncbi:hypothetical protein QFC21_005734 [Naganishia friedmannii]|uniref:Uncharacterized protein n=1 Tax=Naganishia friedmannii TaxID=89922 RepID=A0ACC2V6N6_9TREE|nr:hypothetical protein QFC21_005734 [Naganishia friedmannii]